MREPCAGSIGRLRKRPDFVAAASGRRFHTERMTVQGRLREADCGIRFGLTVTKRVGHATERNRIKRRLRTACQKAGLDFRHVDADVVIIGRRDILTADYALLIDDLRRALRVVTKPKDPKNPRSGDKNPRSGDYPLSSSPPTNGERRGNPHA